MSTTNQPSHSPSTPTLQGQTVLVTGGTSGIGYGVALASLRAGASKIILASSSEERVRKAVERLQKSASEESEGQGVGENGGAKAKDGIGATEVKGVVVDARDLGAIEQAMKGLGKVNHLVWTSGDNLGGAVGSNVRELDVAGLKDKGLMDIRFWAAIQAAKSVDFVPGGSVTLTSGSLSDKPIPGWGIIASLANATNGLTKGLALDLAPDVRVNCVMPGLIDTEYFEKTPPEMKGALFNQVASKALMRRVGKPDDVAEAYLFFMKCGYVTGQTIIIDGGYNLA